MQRLSRTALVLLAVFSLLSSFVLSPFDIRPVKAAPLAGITITVDTGNNSNARDNELSLYEALSVADGAKTGCFTDHEKNQISGPTWALDVALDCGESPLNLLWNMVFPNLFPATIQFASNLSDMTVDGALPEVTTQTTIDGTVSAGKVRLLKSGTWSGPGLTISGCTGCSFNIYIHNLKIEGFSGDGITNLTNGLTDSNFLGLEIYNNTGTGINLSYGSSTNPRNISIGGPSAAERNLIYNNGGSGISIQATAAADLSNFNTLIEGNWIGMNGAGTAFGNGGNGIILSNVRGVTVGGSTSAYANTIVHNLADGVRLVGASANNLISNNYIGAESGGPLDRGNGGSGVALLSGATNNTVSLNLISGNNGTAGVMVSGNTSNTNSILSNSIGLGSTSALGNSGDGILLTGGTFSNVLTGNGIGWNGQNGVHISGAALLNQLYSNYIGVNGAFIIGNTLYGVLIDGGANHNQVGAAGAGNFIGSNGSDGVNIQGAGTGYNNVLANTIGASNTGLPRPNNSGVALLNGTAHNTIGAAGAGNTIVSNLSAGVFIADAGTTANLLYANFIGTTAASASGYGNAGAGVYIAAAANNNNVGAVGLGNIISGNGGPGVDISTNGNVVSNNRIGTNVDGTAALGNHTNGVRLSGGAQGNFIGYSNLVSGNTGDGIQLISGSSNNYVFGNIVGLNAAKTAKLSNTLSGVALASQASGNLVGTGGAGNFISGNTGMAGIYISDPGTNNNSVEANTIGTNDVSAFGLGNSGDGVIVLNGAAGTAIGNNLDVGSRNLIAGNGGNGVQIRDATTTTATVAGNYIGTNAAGTQALPNALAGVAVISATSVTIGGDASTAAQCISGNGRQGVYAQGTQQLKIKGTQYIGNQCNGNFGGLGNVMEGILLDTTQFTVVTPAIVAYNGAAGIAVIGANAQYNMLHPGVDFANGGLAIDLNYDGPTPNDPGDADIGPNGLLNYPEVKTISGSTISGTACANCTIFVYLAVGNPRLAHGGAQASALVAYSSATGAWSITLSGGLTLLNATVQACQGVDCLANPDANTSELGPLSPAKAYLPLVRK